MKRWKSIFPAAVLLAACTVQETADNSVTEELQIMFDQAAEGLIGVRYIPEELLETEPGRYYRFLCEKQRIGMILSTQKEYSIVTVYDDPDGTAEIVDIQDK